ncbi:MAG: T9SS type A sorting domain-containing protein, partial [Gemmatimonadetes bacterium]|nr:T9SS type A sorting domain-containing protein [Gemmatimonadota bacterium]
GDLMIEGISGRVEMGEERGDFLSASRTTEEGLRVVFAGAEATSGSGELLRVYGVGAVDVQLTRADLNGGSMVVRIGETERVSSVPSAFALYPNHPNPFNPETTIGYDVAEKGSVRLRVYDVAGQVVRELIDSVQPAGSYRVVWDGRDKDGAQVANGVYLYELTAGDYRAIRKMTMMK